MVWLLNLNLLAELTTFVIQELWLFMVFVFEKSSIMDSLIFLRFILKYLLEKPFRLHVLIRIALKEALLNHQELSVVIQRPLLLSLLCNRQDAELRLFLAVM